MAQATSRSCAVGPCRGGSRVRAASRAWPVAVLLALTVMTAGSTGALAASPTGSVVRPPAWAQLNATQKQFLAPLSENWDALSSETRRKLVGLADRQAKMSAEQRERVQSRLAEWTQLSPEERALARRNYQQLSRLPSDQRQDVARRWQEVRQGAAPAAPGAPGSEPATVRQ
jgi:hypothetical protein